MYPARCCNKGGLRTFAIGKIHFLRVFFFPHIFFFYKSIHISIYSPHLPLPSNLFSLRNIQIYPSHLPLPVPNISLVYSTNPPTNPTPLPAISKAHTLPIPLVISLTTNFWISGFRLVNAALLVPARRRGMVDGSNGLGFAVGEEVIEGEEVGVEVRGPPMEEEVEEEERIEVRCGPVVFWYMEPARPRMRIMPMSWAVDAFERIAGVSFEIFFSLLLDGCWRGGGIFWRKRTLNRYIYIYGR